MEGAPKSPVYDVEGALFMCGNAKIYQIRAIAIITLQFMASAFIAAGWDLLFQTPKLICTAPDSALKFTCSREQACEGSYRYEFDKSDSLRNIAEQFDLVCPPRSNWIVYTDVLFKLGLCVGALYGGLFMQRYGRRKAMLYMISIVTLFAVLGHFSFSIQSFAVFALCINFGFGGFSISSMVMITEISSDNLRKLAPSLFMMGWSIGQIVIGVISSYYFEWKEMQLFMMGIPLIILTLLQLNIKESARFLVVKKQYPEAKQVILQIADINRRVVDPNFQFYEQLKYQQLKSNVQQLLFDFDDQLQMNKKSHSYLSLFQYNSLRVRSFIILYIWGTISISYYLTSFEAYKYSKGLRYHIVTMGIIELISYLICANFSLVHERLKVIKYALLLIGASHILFLFAPVHRTQYFNLLAFYFLCIIRLAVSGFACFLNVYIQEVYPTSLRHFAFGLTTFWQKFAWVFIPLYSQLCYNMHISPLIPVGVFVLAGLPMIQKLRETLDKPLKDEVDEEQDALLTNQFV